MKKGILFLAGLGLLSVGLSARGQEAKKSAKSSGNESALSASPSTTEAKSASETEYIPVLKYDPARNAERDIQDALAEAKRTDKRVLVEVGGLWCIWCTHMDEFFEKQPDLLALREQAFVMVKVNYSDENKNEALLKKYPKVAGYPHIFVLGADGTLLHSQDTGDLEEGKSYNLGKFTDFLKHWATAPADTPSATSIRN
jgi:thiol-disulfide isomerase/thioredoxin